MKYIVYQTTNKVNNKIYIGVHATETPDIFDGYLGCGAIVDKPSSYNKGKTHLHNAILKYGVSEFYRHTLRVFDTLDDALDLEAWIVTDDFVRRSDTYNMILGGGYPPVLSKTIYQFTLTGVLVKTWESIISITNHYNCNKDRITMVIQSKRSFDNYYWSEYSTIDISTYRLSHRGYVVQYNRDGDFLKEFESASIAAIQLDIDRQAISNSVYNRTLCCGYYFLNTNESINDLLLSKQKTIKLNTTKVYKYSILGELISEYSSIVEAIKDTPKSSNGNIIRAIKNNRTCGGYKWSYEKSETFKNYKQLAPVKIAQYDINRNLIKIWDSVTECKEVYPSCQKVCRKERKSTNNYIFEYIS